MKTNSLTLLICLFFAVSCENDLAKPQTESQDLPLETRGAKAYVCHNGHIIHISVNAVPAHLVHLGGADAVDMDEDGYFDKANPCSENVDCDDNDPDVTSCCPTEGLLTVTLPGNVTLYVQPNDNSTSIPWGGFGIDIPGLPHCSSGASAAADFNGESNTEAIVNALGNGNYAAKVCADLNIDGCDDWYLPSAGELNAIYEQLGPAGTNGFADDYYWSSTDYWTSGFFEYAWYKQFNTGILSFSDRTENHPCRCVRR